jgi:transcriptional regulator with XRE-family HTH domain
VGDVEAGGIEDFYKTVGERIQSARLAAGISQAQIATTLGLTRSSVANLEAARQHISLFHFVLVSQALNTAMDDLLPHKPASSLPEIMENELADSPKTTRAFVRGAVARLHASNGEE